MKLTQTISALAFFAIVAPLYADSTPQGSTPTFETSVASTSSASLPINRVTLYSSGVGFFERRGNVDGNSVVPLSFTKDQMNDVLKSLVLLDYGGGQIDPITFAAEDPVSKELQAYSVDLSDNPSQATLLTRLRGQKVTITIDDGSVRKSVDGLVTSVELVPSSDNSGDDSNKAKPQKTFVTLFCDDDSFKKIDLSTVDNIQIDDREINKEIAGALAAIARSGNADKRLLDIDFRGKGKRQVYVSYVVEAPVWKTTYRLLLSDKPILQGWGIVENTSADDWNDVILTLVSGRPVSFIQDLYAPYYVPRPTIELQLGYNAEKRNGMFGAGALEHAVLPPTAADFPVAQNGVRATYFNPKLSENLSGNANVGALSASNAQNALASAMNTGGETVGESLFKYSIKTPVSIPRGQSAMIPFLSSPIDAKRLAVYNRATNAFHPMSGARIVNTSGLTLNAGAVTVLDGDENVTYSGDAMLQDLQPGESKLITYAVDLPVDVSAPKNDDIQSSIISFQLHKGVLNIESKQIAATKYVFKNKSKNDQTVVVQKNSPGDNWTLIEPEKNVEKTNGLYQYDLNLPAGKETTTEIKFSYVNWQGVALTDTDTDAIAEYAKNASINPKVQAALQEIAHQRKKVANAQANLDAINAKIKDIEDSQNHIRENMKELSHTDALYVRYVKELNDQETKYENLSTERDAAQASLNAAKTDLSNSINSVDITD